MLDQTPWRIALYLRVSDPRQAEKGLSIPDQEIQLRAWAKNRGHKVVKVYIEPGASARDDRRPVFQQMIFDASGRSSPFDAILTLTTSRFFREAMLAQYYKHKLRKKGVRVVAAHQETTDDLGGWVTERIFEVFDQYESLTNSYHTARAMRENSRRGFLNNSPKFGFGAEIILDSRGNQKKRPVINLVEAQIIKRMYDLAASEVGALEIAKTLTAEGLTKRNGRPFSKQEVLDRLHDSANMGEYAVCRFKKGTRKLRPKDEWVIIPVEPIVEPELWDRVAGTLAARAPKVVNPAMAGSRTLLTGLLRCGKCGGAMRLETARGRNGTHFYYNCRTRLRQGKIVCEGTRLRAQYMDTMLLDHVSDNLFTPERVRLMLMALAESTGSMATDYTARRRALESERRGLEQRLERQYGAIETGIVTPHDVGDRIRDLKARKDEIDFKVAAIPDPRDIPAIPVDDESVRALTHNLEELLKEGDRGLARRYLKLLIEKIVVEDETVRVYPRASGIAGMALGEDMDQDHELTTGGVVHTTVSARLPAHFSGMNQVPGFEEDFHTCYIVELSAYRQKKRAEAKAKRGSVRSSTPAKLPKTTPPRVVGLMEKAHQFRQLLDDGEAANRAELARLDGVSRARITQIMKLLWLAPEIQDAIVCLPPGTPERLVTERKLRPIVEMDNAADQIAAFLEMTGGTVELVQPEETKAG